MARIRIATELLEHLLDLPEGVEVADALGVSLAEGIPVIELKIVVIGGNPDSPVIFTNDDTLYALQYEETEVGTSLVSAIPVPD